MPSAQRPAVAAAVSRAGTAPGAWPLMGHLTSMYRDPLGFLARLPRYGELVEIRLGRMPVHLVCHPELVRSVLADDRTYDRSGPLYERSQQAMGNGLATCPHADHRRQRRLLQPAFRPDHLTRYTTVMQQTINEAMADWQPGEEFDLADELFALSTTTALRALFDAELGPRTPPGLQDALDTFLKGIYWQALTPWSRRIPTPGSRRYARALRVWRGHTDRLIAQHSAAGSAADAGPAVTDQRNVLAHLLAARDASSPQLTGSDVHDQVTSLLLAGSETTAAALAWACHLLAADPETQRRLHDETDSQLAGRPACWDDLPRLPLTGHVITETLRLYPPAWLIPRVTTRDTELAGLGLAAGTTVVCSPYVIHRRGDLYPDPGRFHPDRWRTGADRGVAAATARGRYLPFGLGPHRCIGESFALAEATLALAAILGRWTLEPVPGTTVRPAPRAVLAPQRLPMRLRRRETSHRTPG